MQGAEELFLARGFDDGTVSDIAERAEVGRTTFFRHFRDKQEVVFAKEQELLDTIATADLGGDTAALDAMGASGSFVRSFSRCAHRRPPTPRAMPVTSTSSNNIRNSVPGTR